MQTDGPMDMAKSTQLIANHSYTYVDFFDSCYLIYTQFGLSFHNEHTYFGATFANHANLLAK